MNEFQFKIDGPIFRSGIPIYLATTALDSFQTIVDKTYLVSANAKKMTARERDKFYLKATEFKEGSLLVYFEIALQGVQLSMPLISSVGPQNIWDFTKETFKFLKLVCGAVQKGEKPTYKFDNNGNANVQIGNNEYNFHGSVIVIGQSALPSYQDLANLIKDNKISDISAGLRGNESDIHLNSFNRNLFDLPKVLNNQKIALLCEIFNFDKHKNIGKLLVSKSGQDIPPGEYKFSILNDKDNLEYIQSMIQPQVFINCQVEKELSPFGDDKISKLIIFDVRNKN